MKVAHMALALSIILTPIYTVEAGLFSKIKGAIDTLTDTKNAQRKATQINKTNNTGRMEAVTKRRLSNVKAADQASIDRLRGTTGASIASLSRAATIGIYTFSGVMVYDALSNKGYAASPVEYEQDLVFKEVVALAATGEANYSILYCKNKGQKYVLPNDAVSCMDGSNPQKGVDLDLQEIREQAI